MSGKLDEIYINFVKLSLDLNLHEELEIHQENVTKVSPQDFFHDAA